MLRHDFVGEPIQGVVQLRGGHALGLFGSHEILASPFFEIAVSYQQKMYPRTSSLKSGVKCWFRSKTGAQEAPPETDRVSPALAPDDAGPHPAWSSRKPRNSWRQGSLLTFPGEAAPDSGKNGTGRLILYNLTRLAGDDKAVMMVRWLFKGEAPHPELSLINFSPAAESGYNGKN